MAAEQPVVDWTAVERSPEFRELTRSRTRFAMTATVLGVGVGVLVVVLTNVAQDAMRERVLGGMSLGFALAAGLVILTWAITFAYLRRSKRTWVAMEERVRELASAGGKPRETEAQHAGPPEATPASRTGRFERGAAPAPAAPHEEVRR